MQTLSWKFSITLKRAETMTKFRIKNYDYLEQKIIEKFSLSLN